MAERYANGLNEQRRLDSGHAETTYVDVMGRIKDEYEKVGLLFIFVHPDGVCGFEQQWHAVHDLIPESTNQE